MKYRHCLNGLLALFIITGIVLVLALNSNDSNSFTVSKDDEFNLNAKNLEDFNSKIKPKLSSNEIPLPYDNITRNTTIVRRVFESINITIDVSGFQGANITYMEITFTNNSVNEYNMSKVGPMLFSYTYSPEYYAPLGFQTVSFLIYNATGLTKEDWIQLNTQTTHTNFTIISSCMVGLNGSEYYRGQFLKADMLFNESISSWNISVVDEKNRAESKEKFINLTVNPYQFILEIDGWFAELNKYYYIKVNMSQNDIWTEEYYEFRIINYNPRIVVSTISISSTSIYRTKSCRINLNVSDADDAHGNINVSMTLEDPQGSIDKDNFINNNDGSHEVSFSVGAIKPIGSYNVNITARDKNGGTDSYYTSIIVKNNPPIINGYKINDLSMEESISIMYGEKLVFTFNVSDKEGIAYITVILVDENNNWYNITREYFENVTISIRTVDLMIGVWYVYVNVTDTDGECVGLDFDYNTAPQEITITPDIVSDSIQWITFIMGLTIGILGGIGLLYYFVKKGIIKTKTPIVKDDKVKPKKVASKKKPVKKKTVPEKKEAEEKGVKKVKPKKQDETPRTPQRKIKRKLK